MGQPHAWAVRISAILLVVLVGLGGTCSLLCETSPPQVNDHIALLNPPSAVRKHPPDPRAGFEPRAEEKLLGLLMLTAYLESNSEKQP